MLRKNELVKLRAPLSVNLEVTEKCNLSCGFCFNAAPKYTQLMKEGEAIHPPPAYADKQAGRRDRLYRILDRLAEAEVLEVRFFGGEFTVFKYWRDVLRYARSKDFFISFVSNAYLITEADAQLLSECGVRECTVSIHGSEDIHDEVVGKRGSFTRAMKAISFLEQKGIIVSIAYTPNVTNLEHVYGFVRLLSESYGVKHSATNRLFSDDRYQNLTHADYMELLVQIEKCHREMGVNISLGDSFPRCKVPLRYWPYLSYCSQGVAFAQVDFNGNIKHCSAISQPLGNVLETPVSELWDSQLAGMRRLDHLPRSCKICPIFCGGGCTASRGVDNKFVPDEFLRLPENENFFQAYAKSISSLFRKALFKLFHERRFLPAKQGPKSLLAKPTPNQRYRIRQEDQETYVGMFERSGTKFLTPLAVKVLDYADGSRTVDDIVDQCKREGCSCGHEEVVELLQELT